MAHPFIASYGFETGANPMTAASGSLIDYPHYTLLANSKETPYRGAYCFRIKLAGGTTSQFLREDTAFDDLDNGVTRWLRWYFFLAKDFAMADSDKFSMFEAESTLNTTTEAAAGILRDGSNINFWYNETTAAASPSTITLGTTTTALGKWFHAELKIVLSSGGTGTIDGYINDVVGTQITTLTQSDIVDAKFGAIGPDAGTSGTLLIDDIIYDDGQIYRDRVRYRQPNAQIIHASDHPIIGPGKFAIAVTGTGTDAVLSLYDTDGVPTRLEPFAVIRNVSANEFVPGHDIFEVSYGLYTVMSGTGPQAFVSLDCGGVWSDGTVINRGLKQGAPRPRSL